MSSAWTQSELEAIEKAIATGVLTVRYQDKQVTYRSMDELIKARSLMIKALKKRGKKSFYPSHSKGLYSAE